MVNFNVMYKNYLTKVQVHAALIARNTGRWYNKQASGIRASNSLNFLLRPEARELNVVCESKETHRHIYTLGSQGRAS